MLKGINPILTGRLLKVLSNMGHGDEIVIADGNFAATGDSMRRRPIRAPSSDALEVVEAILSVFPLDEGRGAFGHICEQVSSRSGDEGEPDTQGYKSLRRGLMTAVLGIYPDLPMEEFEEIPRLMFHERAKKAYAIVATTDPRHYACFILRKGALPEPAPEQPSRFSDSSLGRAPFGE